MTRRKNILFLILPLAAITIGILWVANQESLLRAATVFVFFFWLPGFLCSYFVFRPHTTSFVLRIGFAMGFGFVVCPLAGFYIEKISGLDETISSAIFAVVISGIASCLLLWQHKSAMKRRA